MDKHFPKAQIVFDKYYIVKQLNKTMDNVLGLIRQDKYSYPNNNN